jgi:predicted ATPase
LQGLTIEPGDADTVSWPWTLPAFQQMADLSFDTSVTFFAGDNGTGKSTVLEAIARGCGCPEDGGPAGRWLEAPPWEPVRPVLDGSPVGGAFFMRAESFFNLATAAESGAGYANAQLLAAFDDRSPHLLSHGQAFLGLFEGRMHAESLWFMDEPEAPLSFQSQLTLIGTLDLLARRGSQFVIATHSPILLALPGATIYEFSDDGIRRAAWEELDVVQQTRSFLDAPERYFRHLLSDEP